MIFSTLETSVSQINIPISTRQLMNIWENSSIQLKTSVFSLPKMSDQKSRFANFAIQHSLDKFMDGIRNEWFFHTSVYLLIYKEILLLQIQSNCWQLIQKQSYIEIVLVCISIVSKTFYY
jgi:hypothetical protein